MTKKELMLALQKFPEDTAVQVKAGGQLLLLSRVEMAVDMSAQTVDTNFDSWQTLVANRIRLVLVGESQKEKDK